MKFKLAVSGKVKYSNGEQNVFKTLSVKPQSSTDMLKKIYPRNKPLNGRKIMIGMIKSLVRKTAINKEPFKICQTDRNGPHAAEFWLEGR